MSRSRRTPESSTPNGAPEVVEQTTSMEDLGRVTPSKWEKEDRGYRDPVDWWFSTSLQGLVCVV